MLSIQGIKLTSNKTNRTIECARNYYASRELCGSLKSTWRDGWMDGRTDHIIYGWTPCYIGIKSPSVPDDVLKRMSSYYFKTTSYFTRRRLIFSRRRPAAFQDDVLLFQDDVLYSQDDVLLFRTTCYSYFQDVLF